MSSGTESTPKGRDLAVQRLRDIAVAACRLAEHLAESWPVRGQGPPPAGPPTHVTFNTLEFHLLNLGRPVAPFISPVEFPPKGPEAKQAWNAWITDPARVISPPISDAVSRLWVVFHRLASEFDSDTPVQAANGFWPILPVATPQTSRPWHPKNGGPVPEVEPGDINTLLWASRKICHFLEGESPPEAPSTRTVSTEVVPAENQEIGPASGMVRWDEHGRKLWYGKHLVRKYTTQPAPN